MEFRSPNDDDELGGTTTTTRTPSSSLRASAFSKPTLSTSSSLISSRPPPQAPQPPSQSTRNGNIFITTTSSNPSPPPPMATDHSLAKSPDPCPPSNSPPTSTKPTAVPGVKVSPLSSNSIPTDVAYKYKECLRNHAANIGVHVVDGCGEFMPDSDDAFKCAACCCHRSFHRKEPITTNSPSPYYHHGGTAPLPLLPPPHPAASPPVHHHFKPFNLTGFTPAGMVAFGGGGNTSGSGGTTTESSSEERINAGAPAPCAAPRKRFRTKFTAEQKEKMLALAERIGWRVQKQDEALVEQFCAEAGIRRQVLKVWMHNNKHIVRRQQELPHSDHLAAHQQIHSSSTTTMQHQ